MDGEALVSSRGTVEETDLTFGDSEGLRQILDEVLVGFAIDWRRGDSDLEALCAMWADNLICGGARLNP